MPRPLSVLVVLLAGHLTACSCREDRPIDDTGLDDTDTDTDTDTDVVDTEVVDTEVVDTDVIDTEVVDTDTDPVVVDTFDPELGCASFTAADWTYHGNHLADGWPAVTDDATVTLTEDGVLVAASAVLSTHAMQVPYRIRFEYQTEDDDGSVPAVFESADGLVLMVLKDAAAYEATAVPASDARGFIADGTGYGVHLRTYQPRSIRISDGNRTVLTQVAEGRTFTAGAWTQVVVDVRRDRIDVDFGGGTNHLTWQAPEDLSTAHLGWGFGAATGGEDSAHRVRNVCVGP